MKIYPLGKAWLQEVIRSGHVALATRPLPDRIALTFHELEADQHDAFIKAISHFLDRGYRTVSAAEYVEPSQAIDKRLWVTFDDNHRCWHDALPLFDRLGMKATFFVSSGAFRDTTSKADIAAFFNRIAYDRPGRSTLSTGELIDLHRAGHEIACHSHSHVNLSSLRPDEWHQEIAYSKAHLESLIGTPVTAFSWPYGAHRFFSPALRDYCLGIGLKVIAASVPGLLFQDRMDPTNVHRTRWQFTNIFERNLEDISVDGRMFERLTGRSAVG